MGAREHVIVTDTAAGGFTERRVAHWDAVASNPPRWLPLGSGYRHRLIAIYQFLVSPGQRVLELGSGSGDLLNALRPEHGVGIDFSERQVAQARLRHPDLLFRVQDAHSLDLEEDFDVVILSDLVDDLWDVQAVLERLTSVVSPRTRLVINTYSRLWQAPLKVARWLRIATPVLPQNWLTVSDLENLLDLTGYEVIRTSREILLPVRIPILGAFFNRFLVKLWPFNHLALTNLVVARLRPSRRSQDALVSIVIPARNEEGHVNEIIERTPEIPGGSELIFVEGNSSDDTFSAIERAITAHPERDIRLFQQTGRGKGDAVRLGFSKARGEVLVILDADMTVAPEDLPRFVEALQKGVGEFINGVRLVYPMQKRAMRLLNFLGNKFFGVAFTWLLQQRIKDTLCGTKVLRRADYELIAANRSYFGDFDPFGDFDLLFGASRLNMKIVDLPIRYHERIYGDTNISRWRHGLVLLRMAAFAARRLRFI
jgi:hypothetical protein